MNQYGIRADMQAAPRTAPVGPLGGLNLNALAASAAQETGTRVAGSKGLIDDYLSSVLGQQQAGIGAEADRDVRLQDFAAQQQVSRQAFLDALEDRRISAEQSGDNVRIQAQVDEGKRARDFTGNQNELTRAFETGQAAVNRTQRISEMQEASRLGIDEMLQRALLEQELTKPKLSDFGAESISPTRGRVLAQEGALDRHRQGNPDQWQRDLAAVRKIVEKNGSDPGKLMGALRKKFKGGGSDWVSLALWELGYQPPGE
jgi:hypothetical protein